jgi:hypothetical protein
LKIRHCTQCAYIPDDEKGLERDKPCPRCGKDPVLPWRHNIEVEKRLEDIEFRLNALEEETGVKWNME